MTKQSSLDLFAEAKALAGMNPQHALMVRVAGERLRRFAGRQECVVAIALFAVEASEREKKSAEAFARDMQRRVTSPAVQARRMKRVQSAIALRLPDETDCGRAARIGVAYAEEQVALVVHRAGSALWAAIEKKGSPKRPHGAQDAELFAALGLDLLVRGMSWRPKLKGRDAIRSLIGEGDGAVRRLIEDGQDATRLLLDAAECLYGWQHLKPKRNTRGEWKHALRAIMPSLKTPGGWMSGRAAHKLFEKKHPEFKDLVTHESFKNELSVQKKEFESA